MHFEKLEELQAKLKDADGNEESNYKFQYEQLKITYDELLKQFK